MRFPATFGPAAAKPLLAPRVVAWLAAALLLLALTLVVHRWMERYRPVPAPAGWSGGAAAASGAAAAGSPEILEGWERHGTTDEVRVDAGRVELVGTDARRAIGLKRVLPLPPGIRAIGLAATVGVEGVRGGARYWERAGVYVIGRTADGRPVYPSPYDLVLATGTRSPARLERRFVLAPEVVEVAVYIHMNRATGRLVLEDLAITPLADRPAFTHARAAVTGAWVVVLAWGGWLVVRGQRSRVRAAGLCALALIGLGLLLVPHDLRRSVLDLGGMLTLGGRGPELTADLGHVGLFVVLGGAAGLAFRRARLLGVACLVIVAGALGEAVQLLSDERSAELSDALLNVAGGLIGLTLARALLRVRQKIRHPATAAGETRPG